MSEQSSHRGATTENTYIDLGADTAEGFSISSRSRKLARAAIGSANDEDRVRQRCSIAVGDFEMAKLLRFQGQPIEAGLQALRNKAPILVDIRMVQVGVQKKGHGSEVKCFLDYGQEISKEKGITRTSAGIMALKDEVEGAIIVIGNAPSSLLVLCDMIKEGIKPALVIGAAVGFVNAAESKALLRTMPVPSISVEGTRGGTPVAVAAINEIITIFNEGGHDQ
jgi:precorrin-8X/cobalt-precorrin-8 methylmutase